MKLSTRTRYGIRAMLELACNYGKGPLRLKIIAQHQDISAKYLEQLIAMLKTAGFVRSVRGSKGGYVLAKPPAQINLKDCFNCLEGTVAAVDCIDDESYCDRQADCVLRLVWKQLSQAIASLLQDITLQDLVDKAEKRDKTSDYQI